jgi:uncharacterized membrane protein YtjA (UPF0391 family)
MFLLRWAMVLALVAVVAGILGYTNMAEGIADIARVFFFIFLAGVAILVGLGLTVYKKVTT